MLPIHRISSLSRDDLQMTVSDAKKKFRENQDQASIGVENQATYMAIKGQQKQINC